MYKVAHLFLRFASFIGLALFFTLLIGVAANLLAVQRNEFNTTIFISFLRWLSLFGYPQLILLGAVTVGVLITLVACIIILLEKPLKEHNVLQQYLERIKKENSELQLTDEVHRLYQELTRVKVPLSDNFISLRAAQDRPHFDDPDVQQQHFEEINYLN